MGDKCGNLTRPKTKVIISDSSNMKKVYRRSQIGKIVGKPVFGVHMHLYNLPYLDAGGIFCDVISPDSIDLMLAALDCHFPKIHAVSIMKD